MPEANSKGGFLSYAGGILMLMGFVAMISGVPGLGFPCCVIGIFALIGSAISSANSSFNSGEGKMVLKQDSTGQWNWMSEGANQSTPQNNASMYNEQSSQIMSRVIQEVRGGKTLDQLEPSELDILSSAYGIDSGSKSQKIEALHNSDMARMGLKIGAVAAAGGIGAVGAAHIVKKGRERAIQRAEELREEGRAKLQENIEQGKNKINSKLPTNESGETATEVGQNIVMEQISNTIREKNLTPTILMQIADVDKDGKLDPLEISGALSTAIGFAVPAFIISDAIKDFDLNKDGKLDHGELKLLWAKLGFEEEQETEFSDDEIDNVLEEIAEEVPEEVEITTEETEVETAEVAEVEAVAEGESTVEDSPEQIESEVPEEVTITESETQSGELSDGIDTKFEELILEMEGARFSSERKKLMEKQVSEFLVHIRIQKMERTLIGDPMYRGGKSVHCLLDGGPYVGVVKIPVSLDEVIHSFKEGDEIQVWAKLVDFSPSLKRPVLEASEIV